MSTYLVTGAAGFIAAKVCEQLLAAGHTVVGVDNLNDYYDVRLKLYRLGLLFQAAGASEADVERFGLGVANIRKPETGNLKPEGSGSGAYLSAIQVSGFRSQVFPLKFGRFTFHLADIEDMPALERMFEGANFSAVFNLAARAGVRYSLEFPELYRRTNILGEENVLKCQVKYGVKKHVLASSSSVYAGCPMPFVEDAPLGQMQSPYAETKRAAELLARQYHEQHGLDVTVLRYFTVFGPAGRPDMAPFRFIKWIDEGTPITLYGDGSQARDFTYVDDIARGTILAASRKPETGNLKPESSDQGSGRSALRGDGEANLKSEGPESSSGLRSQVSGFPVEAPRFDIINLGGGNNPLPMTSVIALIEEALGKKAKIAAKPTSAADMKATWADIAKAKHLLGWMPTVTPEEGFERTVAWFQEKRDWISRIVV